MRKLKGTVVSNKMQKTAVVRVDALKKHPKYEKYYRTSRKFKAHDAENEYRIGDVVWIQETRPLSKEKRWKIASLVKRREGQEGEESTAE
ncbi:MAG: small subunit ribosomal protein S17 [Parcubacteria group bacterium Greene0714_36]|nr:MAG: small subunit ribosomal protein S17 [Parcubacteria group bacterium Greene0714_36]